MRDLIRKILRENKKFASDAPDWVGRFKNLSTEERIEFIKDYKKRIGQLIPNIRKFFETKFDFILVNIETEEKKVHYGNEGFSSEEYLLKFYFSTLGVAEEIDGMKLKRQIYSDLKSYFSIDVAYYGTPFNFEVYMMTWQRV